MKAWWNVTRIWALPALVDALIKTTSDSAMDLERRWEKDLDRLEHRVGEIDNGLDDKASAESVEDLQRDLDDHQESDSVHGLDDAIGKIEGDHEALSGVVHKLEQELELTKVRIEWLEKAMDTVYPGWKEEPGGEEWK